LLFLPAARAPPVFVPSVFKGLAVASAGGKAEASRAMALVECPDCGRKVSDQAEACPGCAHPVAGWQEASESKSIAVGGGHSPSRARENRPPARLVVLETPGATAVPAPPPAAPPRAVAPTYRYVCHLCGDEEILLYRAPENGEHVCGTCEEDALVSGVERRRLFHWLPFVLVPVLLIVAALVYLYAPL
jgi:predicted nucleic acid-binding Zn ribbon protein